MPVTDRHDPLGDYLYDYVLGMQGVVTGGAANRIALDEQKRKKEAERREHEARVAAYEARRARQQQDSTWLPPVDRPRPGSVNSCAIQCARRSSSPSIFSCSPASSALSQTDLIGPPAPKRATPVTACRQIRAACASATSEKETQRQTAKTVNVPV
jgi:hypothetical protein